MAKPERNLYDVLGVDRDADDAIIKRAFRVKARTLHPDVSADADAADRFAELSRAYGVLSKPTSRILYDRIGYRGRGNGGFEERDPAGPEIELAEVEVAAFEAARGTKRRVRVVSLGECVVCGGTGAAPRSLVTVCASCGGEGRLRQSVAVGDVRVLQITSCADCAGRGRVVTRPCSACAGEGTARAERTVALEIPPGAEDGALLRAHEHDAAGPGRTVHVLLRVLPHDDARLVRYGSAAALVLALFLFAVLAIAPEALAP